MELMTYHRNYQLLHNLVIDNEEWTLYVNQMHNQQWLGTEQTGIPTVKNALHPEKIMLSI